MIWPLKVVYITFVVVTGVSSGVGLRKLANHLILGDLKEKVAAKEKEKEEKTKKEE